MPRPSRLHEWDILWERLQWYGLWSAEDKRLPNTASMARAIDMLQSAPMTRLQIQGLVELVDEIADDFSSRSKAITRCHIEAPDGK